MYRIYEVRPGARRLLGGTASLQAAQRFVLRLAGNPLLGGAAMGGYRGPNEFLPRTVTGEVRYEIIAQPGARDRARAAAA
jgi:hypothetical protein